MLSLPSNGCVLESERRERKDNADTHRAPRFAEQEGDGNTEVTEEETHREYGKIVEIEGRSYDHEESERKMAA
jgi:hypothetical protein